MRNTEPLIRRGESGGTMGSISGGGSSDGSSDGSGGISNWAKKEREMLAKMNRMKMAQNQNPPKV